MERDSSDEDDDRESFLEQNDRKHPHPRSHEPSSSPRPPSSFHVESDLRNGFRRRFSNISLKSYLFAFSLPLFIIVLYFSTDFRSLFSSKFPVLNLDPVSDRMRESELRALYLLREQHLSLLSIWNRSSSSAVNLSSTTAPGLDSIQSALLPLISLNKQIEQALLSPHSSSNNASSSSDFNSSSGIPGVFPSCQNLHRRLPDRRTIEWKPRPDKFLFAICLSGQMSNHLICLEKHMFFAALLNRVLVFPSSKFDYHYSRVLDIEHINTCVGRKVVLTFEEFMETRKNKLRIDKFICYFSSPTPCYVDEDHVKKLKALGISVGKLESPWNEDIKKPSKRTTAEIVAKFKSDDDVIAIGDVFFAKVETEWQMQPGGPIAHKCKTLIEPSKFIMLTAQRFVQTFLGKNFIALHFRRHGFLKFCNAKQPSCFYPVPQAASCISRVSERANTPVIYLSTDAAESETGLLQSLVVVNGKTIPLVKRPPPNAAEKWDALLYRHHLEGDPQVEAMLDKTICAMSSVFIGSSGSTFTDDILRLRKDWESSSSCDEYLCQGELPDFIAEDE
ncbi:O-fucosyltransferase 5 [Linum perenne]